MTKGITEKIAELQARLGAINDAMTARAQQDDIPGTVRQFIALRDMLDHVSGLQSEIQTAREHWAYVGIPALFERAGVTSYTLKEGYRVTTQTLVRASTRDMEAGIRWCKENEHEFLVKETINASTLAGYARSLAEEGKPDLPTDVFNVNFGMNTSVTKVRG